MAKKDKEAMEGHQHDGCWCCRGGGRGRFWTGILVGLLAAWLISRVCCHGMMCGGGMGYYGKAAHGQMVPAPALKETTKK